MAVLNSIRTKSPIAAFYRHLRNQGKFDKVGMIAAAQKLLIYINSSFKNLPARFFFKTHLLELPDTLPLFLDPS